MRKVLKYFLGWRVLTFAAVFFAGYFISLRTGYLFQNYWGNFDGVHYLSIAKSGYVNQAVFFPLYPIVIKLFSLGRWYFGSAILISNLCFLFAIYYLYKLFKIDYSEDKVRQSLVFLLLFPTSFFFGAVYSESLFLLLLVLSFYFARKSKWFLSIFFASLLTITRIVGILIIPALFYEYYVQYKKINLWILLVSVGLAAYSIFNYLRWGDFLYFVHAHGQLSNGRSVSEIILFPQTFYRYIKIFFVNSFHTFEWWIALLEFGVFIITSYLLFLGIKNKIRTSYLIFSFLSFLAPTLSGTFSGLPRYVLVLFPLFIALTFLNKNFKKVWLFCSTLLLIILTMFFVRGYFIA